MKYQVICNDEDIYAVEAYGQDDCPAFDTRVAAETKMAECVNSWSDDAPVREAYCVVETH